MLRLSRLPMGLALTLSAAVNVLAVPSVTVDMKAAFPSGPYLLELLETAAGENATAYFPLLDRIANGYFSEAKTDKDVYDKFLHVLNEDGHVNTPDALSTFKLALSLRTAAPRIEAHYQYYRTAVEPKLGSDAQDGCEAWVELGGKQYCAPTLDTPKEPESALDGSKVLPFDRVLGSGGEAILYADPASSAFGPFHSTLAEKARKGEIEYRLRYTKPAGIYEEPLPVSGYGVELALKRTDYIVIDDREAQSDDSQKIANAGEVLDAAEDVADLKPLAKSELQELGLKAASFIMQSQDPFETLLRLTQDFPKFSTSIAAHNVSTNFLAEHQLNRQQLVPSGMNVLWMNGVQLIERQIEAFTIIDLLRRERKLIDGVRDLGFTGGQAVSLLGHPKVAESKADDEPPRFDWTDDEEKEEVIMFLNDLEKDERYKDFPSQLTALLQRVYPGQLPPIRRDIFNLIVPVDFSKIEDLNVVAQLNTFIQRKVPIRFGLVPLTPTEDAAKITKVLYYLLDNYGLEVFIEYLDAAMQDAKTEKPDQSVFEKAIKDREPLPTAKLLAFDDVLQSQELHNVLELARSWVKRLNANTPIPPVFINGIPVPRENNWLQAMSMKASSDLQTIQRAVYFGAITEEVWFPDFFLEKAVKRRNTYIYPEDDKSIKILDVNKIYTEHDGLFSNIPAIEAYADSTKENWAVLTIVGDFVSDQGASLLLTALAFRRSNPGVRLDIVYNPPTSASASAVNTALKNSGDKLAEVESISDLKAIFDSAAVEPDGMFTAALSKFLSFAAIKPGSNLVILNGRVIGPFTEAEPFQGDDFQFLLEFEQKARILPVYAAVDDLGLTDKISGPLAAAKITSVTALSTISDLPADIFESAPSMRVSAHDQWNSTYTAIEIGNPETSSVHIVGVLNPASEQAQRWAPILKVVSKLDGVYLKLFLNPQEKIDELPVKRFFRYVLESEPSFDEAGKVRGLEASFKGLPSEALLNAGMDVPPSWLVAPKVSVHDPDNIKLSSIKSNVYASYELESILIEGHSREGGQSQPPRGAQLVLGTEKEPHFADTIIMANLGYFQFKASPGFYNIQLKSGRSSEIYTIDSIGAKGWNPVPGDEGTEVVLMDFQGTTLYPRLSRKPGQEEADVLAEPEDNSIVGRGLKFAEGILGKKKSASDEEHAEINIFSVASGHLYERMLNIMMVSVMKNTKHTVKFWFIEQFLSPSFKDFIPHMAKEYGFKYEMVTFKWPHWLRQQKEKQREIWGYKILFLDVLFPLSLDKVIFVDADQIVRTDMISLVNHDLEGKPYGFTPMCDSRTEMEGFRFWKQGYWANYLRGQPYHISALYVVDLRRFRELAAGDRLRQTYHSLSADPNSLANLDQDLPNHMQFQIPIHSLPQEWLWCETWCSDESQKDAKTIDLCNNPQTKEPKLDRARRQVPEWSVYDNEIAALDRKRKGLLVEAPKKEETKAGGGGEGEQQKPVIAEEDKNTKSRNWEEPPAENTHVIDEL
ncbi:UDP-glucose:Glycoprotein Glucosyltransferase [Colletotrichum graminicola]|uniref:UDP-glucose:Glycoprotein Glucosyltransferase n=1 Tax=Colletotrichum graminicola (strain M1.001 / M2 / FGSC 10212) TaxID=645133 RepID=E3QHX9_COLGM|nr:UDP-glucose:Glycoprotein Glucosyltransferase [Colletotrichum graminicola M1.001]EFQ30467.1 UDP-glucose:Glycoprotein Glucosyltransferase [Colletotrichum graminicola M1.001]WDK18729.1 UDP-glucose:Glycoprotein Glucosyltransferase [Colletotrichum graminicola]